MWRCIRTLTAFTCKWFWSSDTERGGHWLAVHLFLFIIPTTPTPPIPSRPSAGRSSPPCEPGPAQEPRLWFPFKHEETIWICLWNFCVSSYNKYRSIMLYPSICWALTTNCLKVDIIHDTMESVLQTVFSAVAKVDGSFNLNGAKIVIQKTLVFFSYFAIKHLNLEELL